MSQHANIGRPRIYKTPEESAKAKKEQDKIHQKRYQEVRRERYRSDPAYRKSVVERERERYKATRPDYEEKGFGTRAGRAGDFAAPRMVKQGKLLGSMECLSIPQMAEFIGVVPKVLNGWITSGKFPRPRHSDENGLRIFTVGEANKLASVLKAGLEGRRAFRTTDTALIMKLHGAF
jgi:hypothetical protein